VASDRPDHHDHWRRAIQGKMSTKDWQEIMVDYRGGVDYPVSFYYKELMEAFPNSKVLLNVRDPVKWYQSVKNSILRMMTMTQRWPVTWFSGLIGRRSTFRLIKDLTENVPSCSSTGLGLFGAVRAGQDTAVQFYNDHVNEVKSHVPADRLLVWEVKEGWEPLCKFLGVPVPDEPFPRVNDTDDIERGRRTLLLASWTVVVLVPGAMAFSAWKFSFDRPVHFLGMAAGYMLAIGAVKSFIGRNMMKVKDKKIIFLPCGPLDK